jgi:hypothetical protein
MEEKRYIPEDIPKAIKNNPFDVRLINLAVKERIYTEEEISPLILKQLNRLGSEYEQNRPLVDEKIIEMDPFEQKLYDVIPILKEKLEKNGVGAYIEEVESLALEAMRKIADE